MVSGLGWGGVGWVYEIGFFSKVVCNSRANIPTREEHWVAVTAHVMGDGDLAMF